MSGYELPEIYMEPESAWDFYKDVFDLEEIPSDKGGLRIGITGRQKSPFPEGTKIYNREQVIEQLREVIPSDFVIAVERFDKLRVGGYLQPYISLSADFGGNPNFPFTLSKDDFLDKLRTKLLPENDDIQYSLKIGVRNDNNG